MQLPDPPPADWIPAFAGKTTNTSFDFLQDHQRLDIRIRGDGAYLAVNRVQIPIPIKPIPEISFMVFAETNLSSSEPITTAKKVAMVKAHEATARIPQQFISLLLENRRIEICVLSPISARNVMKKTIR